MQTSNPFETTHPTPEPNLIDKVSLIARVDLAFAVFTIGTWIYVGATPATKWGAYAILVALVGALTFGAASLIGWLRLDDDGRRQDWLAPASGLASFTIGVAALAFYAGSMLAG